MNILAETKIEPEKTKVAWEFKHTRPLIACAWDPKNRYLFFGAEDNLVHRYELANKQVTPLAHHDSWVRSLGSSPDGEVFYSGGYDGRLVWWPAAAEKPTPIRTIQAHQGWLRSLASSPDGKFVATCGNDRLVKLWDASDGKLIKEFAGHQCHVYNVVVAPDSNSVFSCDLKGVVNRWHIASGERQELATVKALHGYDTTFRADIGGARSISLRGDGSQLALGGITNVTNAFAGVGEIAVALVNLTQPKLDLLLESKDKTRGTTWGVAYHPAGFWIGLSGGSGGWLYFWKGDTNHEFFKMKLKDDGRGLCISPDRNQVAIAHADMHLRAYTLHG